LVGVADGHVAGLGSNPNGRRFISPGFISEKIPSPVKSGGGFFFSLNENGEGVPYPTNLVFLSFTWVGEEKDKRKL
jgi:hypothetical protein